MELIELLIKLNESLKGLEDHDNIHIELKKHDGKYTIKRFYSQGNLTEMRPDGSVWLQDGSITIDGKQLAEMVVEEINKNEQLRQRFSSAE